MAADLPATIIEVLLADERLQEATQDFLARWAVRQDWGYALRVDEHLNVRLSIAPEDVGFDGRYGETEADPWAIITFPLEAWDGFGDEGPAQARATAARLRALADELDASAGRGEFGAEEA